MMVQFENLPSSKGQRLDAEDLDRDQNSTSSAPNTPNGTLKRKSEEGHGSKKRNRKSKSEKGTNFNGIHSHSKRRHSVSKPARDPRDEAAPPRSANDGAGTRSPSPVIDFDGLSRPSRFSNL